MTILIVDDEPRARDGLRILIQQHVPDIDTIHEASDAIEASQIVHKGQVDLVFLDIEMPGESGISWLAKQVNRNFEVIFTTAYNEFAIQAIRLAALDYLQKPINVEELVQAYNRFKERRTTLSTTDSFIQVLMHNMSMKPMITPRVAIPIVGGSVYFDVADIILCEAHNNYTTFYISGGQKHVASQTLKEYDDLLNEFQFLRVHQSYLVNPHHILRHTKSELLMRENHHVPVSRRKQQWLSEKLTQLF